MSTYTPYLRVWIVPDEFGADEILDATHYSHRELAEAWLRDQGLKLPKKKKRKYTEAQIEKKMSQGDLDAAREFDNLEMQVNEYMIENFDWIRIFDQGIDVRDFDLYTHRRLVDLFLQEQSDHLDTLWISTSAGEVFTVPYKDLMEMEHADIRKRYRMKKSNPGRFVFDTRRPPEEFEHMLGNAAVYDQARQELIGWHITDDPEDVLKTLKRGDPLKGFGYKEQDLGQGLYVSAVPQLWMARALSKWDFLTWMTPTQSIALAMRLEEELYHMPAGYITSWELERALQILSNVKNGVFSPPTPLVLLAEQPYNIKFWKKEFLEPIGIAPAAQPEPYRVRFRGRYVRCDTAEDMEREKKARTYDGAYIPTTIMSIAQLCIWKNEALISFADVPLSIERNPPALQQFYIEYRKLSGEIKRGLVNVTYGEVTSAEGYFSFLVKKDWEKARREFEDSGRYTITEHRVNPGEVEIPDRDEAIDMVNEFISSYPGRTDFILRAIYRGVQIGFISYAVYEFTYREDASTAPGDLLIGMIYTLPKYRRQGVAAAMWEALLDEWPDEEIDLGWQTEDGQAFFASLK